MALSTFPATSTGRIELLRDPDTEEIIAYHVTETRVPIAAQKFTVTKPIDIPNALSSFGALTTPFSLSVHGKEWVAAAQILKLPLSWLMMPAIRKSDKKLVLAPKCGANYVTPANDEDVQIGYKYTSIDYIPPKCGKMMMLLVNGFPWIMGIDKDGKTRKVIFPNVHSSGEVCADPYTKCLIAGCEPPSDYKQVVGKVTRDSSIAEIAYTTAKLWFTTPCNQDLCGSNDFFLAPVDDKGKIEPVQLPDAMYYDGLSTSSLMTRALNLYR